MTGYVIADANKSIFVRQEQNGSYSLTTDKNRALIFDSKPAADTVFKSNLSKLIKSKGVAVSSITLQIAGENHTKMAKSEIETVTAPNADFGSSKHIIAILSDAASKLNRRYMELVDEQSKYDRQITDVEHYIEFNAGKLNACDGFKAYKLLQSILVKRRKIKDELQLISVVKDKMAISDDISSINERVRELESREYVPRELDYLFKTKS